MSHNTLADDVRRFGKARAMRIYDHAELRDQFIKRQHDLVAAGCVFLLGFALSELGILAALCCWMFTTASRECLRMRTCGRYWQCQRSIEVIGI